MLLLEFWSDTMLKCYQNFNASMISKDCSAEAPRGARTAKEWSRNFWGTLLFRRLGAPGATKKLPWRSPGAAGRGKSFGFSIPGGPREPPGGSRRGSGEGPAKEFCRQQPGERKT